MTDVKRYEERDIMALDEAGGFYCRHIDAMTGEGLHGKSDIAAELGYRDMQIQALQADNERMWTTFVKVAEYLGIDAEKARHADGKPSDIYLQHINKLKADAVREFAHSTVLSGRVMEAAILYANKLEDE